MIAFLVAAGVVMVAWWALRRLIMLALVAALLIGAAVWASHPSARHHGPASAARQLHRLERNARHDVTRKVSHDVTRVVHHDANKALRQNK